MRHPKRPPVPFQLLAAVLLSHFCAAVMKNPSYKLRRYEASDNPAIIKLFCDNIREEWGEMHHDRKYLANAERYIDSVVQDESSDLNSIE